MAQSKLIETKVIRAMRSECTNISIDRDYYKDEANYWKTEAAESVKRERILKRALSL